MKAIEFHGLTKFYGKHRGIESIEFSVTKGEIFGFIGPNGAGKSTAIRTLLGLLHPSGGSAAILGHDVVNEGVQARLKVGYLPAEVDFYPEMTSRELLQYHAGLYGLENGDIKIEELAEYFELALDRPIDDLSYGNKKKCAIIQAVLHEPEVLILDEPTGGLDPFMQNRFFELMESLNKMGVTVFFSSHVLSEIQRMCDRAAVIRDGKITAIEDISSLLSKQMKKVRLVLKKKAELSLPDGFQNHHSTGTKHNFDYVGPTEVLIRWLAEQDLVDVVLTEPDLESIFMNYYQR
ncbi:MAG: ABC transporter [Flavobacteriales bacterium]|nr:ABC transporter [Flavobacteriales bacterium]